jgi:exosortase
VRGQRDGLDTNMTTNSKPTDPAAAITPPNSAFRTPHSALKWALLGLPFAYLWFRLINNLRVEWETNPQYSYGYIVPFLCLGLLLHRWHTLRSLPSTLNPQLLKGPWSVVSGPWFLFMVFASLAFLYLPTRLIELATPEWRLIQWALGIIVIGLTLAGIYLGWGWKWLRVLAFPICFFLVAIPWPTFIESPIIQSLTRINAAMVIEVMGALGIPALQHGNVIEVGTGVVGIDEACSGIRSFQSSIMISLFLGALYDLTPLRRILFVPIGFALAMMFNLGRTSFLTYVAAKEGVAAIDKYHDPAGLWIMVGCTVGLWLIGLLMKKSVVSGQKSVVGGSGLEASSGKAEIGKVETAVGKADILKAETLKSGGGGQPGEVASHFTGRGEIGKVETGESGVGGQGSEGSISVFSISAFQRLSLALLAWLLFVEVGSQAWYRSREARLPQAPAWSVVFPSDNLTLKDLPMAPATFNLLRFDDGKQAAWTEPDGTQWQAFYFNWLPGRVAGYLAKRHTPEACLPATGREMLSGPELMVLTIHGLELPVRRYRFGPDGSSLHVYHCRWESGATPGSFVQWESSAFNLVRGIWAGRGNQGQKVVEVIIGGIEDPEAAKDLLVRRLEEMIKVESLSARGETGGAKAESRK